MAPQFHRQNIENFSGGGLAEIEQKHNEDAPFERLRGGYFLRKSHLSWRGVSWMALPDEEGFRSVFIYLSVCDNGGLFSANARGGADALYWEQCWMQGVIPGVWKSRAGIPSAMACQA
jgi:hypothetical protein